MTGAALIGHRHQSMIPLGGFPAGGAVAADAIHRSGYVRASFSCGCTAVVATGAIGSGGEPAMVHASCG